MDFRLSEEACKRIPNIKKLGLMYGDDFTLELDSFSDELQNLGRFQRLESIVIQFFRVIPISKLKNVFPSSTKKLSLKGGVDNREDHLSTIIGLLPHLEVLKLSYSSIYDFPTWSRVEGEFLGLKYLRIIDHVLVSWTLDSGSCFPVLEKLVLKNMVALKEIPSGIGEIQTLQLIRLENCTTSLVISAMKIKEEQESFGNYDLRIQVKMFLWRREELMERVKAEGLSIKKIDLEFDTW